MKIDYNYICEGLGHLSGIEVRAYQGGELTAHYASFHFEPNIANIIYKNIAQRDESVFYVETEDMLVFGVIQSKQDDAVIIIGPTSQIRPDRQGAISILHRLGQSHDRLADLQEYFANMIPYPFENFLEILCFVNYAVNEEKLSVSHLLKREVGSEAAARSTQEPNVFEQSEGREASSNTFQAEKIMLSYVTSGNVEAIHRFFLTPPTGQIGVLAHSELRQRRNAFICAATIISRAAIAGGLPSGAAFALSDRYIQKVELLDNAGAISSLNMDMLLDYTKRVEAVKCGAKGAGALARRVMRFVLKNIDRKITSSDIASSLGMNRTYLCERFKLETGSTLGEFITLVKIDEAKRMLDVTTLSAAQVSEYLAFSSQSYFQNVFKKNAGCTPKEFRKHSQTEKQGI